MDFMTPSVICTAKKKINMKLDILVLSVETLDPSSQRDIQCQ